MVHEWLDNFYSKKLHKGHKKFDERIVEDILNRFNLSPSDLDEKTHSTLRRTLTQLHEYKKYWKEEDKQIKWLHTEKEFCLPFHVGVEEDYLVVLLRGKIDGIFESKDGGLWLFETKTESQSPNDEFRMDLLSYDFQSHFYAYCAHRVTGKRIDGILYNIIKTPSLRQRKSESEDVFLKRIKEDIQDRPSYYFHRFEISIDSSFYYKFYSELDAMLREFVLWCDRGMPGYKNTLMCKARGYCPYIKHCAEVENVKWENYFKFSTDENPTRIFPELSTDIPEERQFYKKGI